MHNFSKEEIVMKNTKYESPRFGFQKMQLIENIADKCWGYHYGWFDPDGPGPQAPVQIDLSSFGSSCNSVSEGLIDYIFKNFDVRLSPQDVSPNTKSTIVTIIPSS